MSRDEQRRSEAERRAVAQRNRGHVRRGSGESIDGRRLDQMVSVRLAPDLVAALRGLAEESGRSISDLLREAAANLVESRSRVTLAVRIDHVVTGPTPTPGSPASQPPVATASALNEVPAGGRARAGGPTAGSALGGAAGSATVAG
jgi:predicted DNA-binding protein